jgi:DNA-binding MarR family transcriptional regulator
MATNRLTDAPALLREVARLHVRAQRATLASHSASVTQCTILTELGRAQPMTLAELARRLRLDKSWTSRAIDRLVDDGLIEKVSSEVDRRTVSVSMTRAGVAHHQRLERLLNDQVARIITRVPKAEGAYVARVLGLLRDAYVIELAMDAEEGSSASSATR